MPCVKTILTRMRNAGGVQNVVARKHTRTVNAIIVTLHMMFSVDEENALRDNDTLTMYERANACVRATAR